SLRGAVKEVSMKKRTLFLATVAVSTLGLATVHARSRFGMGAGPMMGPGGGDGPAMMLPLLLRSAKLTDEQEAQVQKIMADRRARVAEADRPAGRDVDRPHAVARAQHHPQPLAP